MSKYQLETVFRDAEEQPIAGRRVEFHLINMDTGSPVVAGVRDVGGVFVTTDVEATSDDLGRISVDLTANEDIQRVNTRYVATFNGIATTFVMPRHNSELEDLINQDAVEFFPDLSLFRVLGRTDNVVGTSFSRIYTDTLDATTPADRMHINESDPVNHTISISHVGQNEVSNKDLLEEFPPFTEFTFIASNHIDSRTYRIVENVGNKSYGSTVFQVYTCVEVPSSGNATFTDGERVLINTNYLNIPEPEVTPSGDVVVSDTTPQRSTEAEGSAGTAKSIPRSDHRHQTPAFLNGTEDPAAETGEEDDIYVNTANNKVFKKDDGKWVEIWNPIDTPSVDPDFDKKHFVHLGTDNIDGSDSGIEPGGTSEFVITSANTNTWMALEFANTDSSNVPDNVTYDTSNGELVLPVGSWLVCLSVKIKDKNIQNNRAYYSALAIDYGGSIRHGNSNYAANATNIGDNDELNDIQSIVSVTGVVVSDGTTVTRGVIKFEARNNTETFNVVGAHLHAVRQFVSSSSVGPQGESIWVQYSTTGATGSWVNTFNDGTGITFMRLAKSVERPADESPLWSPAIRIVGKGGGGTGTGNRIFTGTGDPNSSTSTTNITDPIDGDIYLNTTDTSVWRYNGTSWNKIIDSLMGQDGTYIGFGANNPTDTLFKASTGEDARVGDLWIDSSDGELWHRLSQENSWAKLIDLKGDPGNDGLYDISLYTDTDSDTAPALPRNVRWNATTKTFVAVTIPATWHQSLTYDSSKPYWWRIITTVDPSTWDNSTPIPTSAWQLIRETGPKGADGEADVTQEAVYEETTKILVEGTNITVENDDTKHTQTVNAVQQIFRVDWADIALAFQFNVGDIISRGDLWFICIKQNRKGETGPDNDPTNWDPITTYAGTYDTTKYYHAGQFVSYQSGVAFALQDVVPADPAPDATSNRKWIYLSPGGGGTGGGNTTYLSTSAPDDADGQNGDIYLYDGSFGQLDEALSIYIKAAGSWANIISLPVLDDNNLYLVMKDILVNNDSVTFDDENKTITITGGGGGANLSDNTPHAIGTSGSSGSDDEASRSDHVHQAEGIPTSITQTLAGTTLNTRMQRLGDSAIGTDVDLSSLAGGGSSSGTRTQTIPVASNPLGDDTNGWMILTSTQRRSSATDSHRIDSPINMVLLKSLSDGKLEDSGITLDFFTHSDVSELVDGGLINLGPMFFRPDRSTFSPIKGKLFIVWGNENNLEYLTLGSVSIDEVLKTATVTWDQTWILPEEIRSYKSVLPNADQADKAAANSQRIFDLKDYKSVFFALADASDPGSIRPLEFPMLVFFIRGYDSANDYNNLSPNSDTILQIYAGPVGLDEDTISTDWDTIFPATAKRDGWRNTDGIQFFQGQNTLMGFISGTGMLTWSFNNSFAINAEVNSISDAAFEIPAQFMDIDVVRFSNYTGFARFTVNPVNGGVVGPVHIPTGEPYVQQPFENNLYLLSESDQFDPAKVSFVPFDDSYDDWVSTNRLRFPTDDEVSIAFPPLDNSALYTQLTGWSFRDVEGNWGPLGDTTVVDTITREDLEKNYFIDNDGFDRGYLYFKAALDDPSITHWEFEVLENGIVVAREFAPIGHPEVELKWASNQDHPGTHDNHHIGIREYLLPDQSQDFSHTGLVGVSLSFRGLRITDIDIGDSSRGVRTLVRVSLVKFISGGKLPDEIIYLGEWANIPTTQTILKGQYTFHNEGFFVCIEDHEANTSGGGPGPDSDPTHWDALNNYDGSWVADWYLEGIITKYNNEFYISNQDITNTDPNPEQSTKWDKITTQTFPTDYTYTEPTDGLKDMEVGTTATGQTLPSANTDQIDAGLNTEVRAAESFKTNRQMTIMGEVDIFIKKYDGTTTSGYIGVMGVSLAARKPNGTLRNLTTLIPNQQFTLAEFNAAQAANGSNNYGTNPYRTLQISKEINLDNVNWDVQPNETLVFRTQENLTNGRAAIKVELNGIEIEIFQEQEQSSPTILRDGEDFLLNTPGSDGIWGGTSPIERGQVIQNTIVYTTTEPSGVSDDFIRVATIPASLAQFLEIEPNSGNTALEWLRVPNNFSMSLELEAVNPLTGTTVQASVKLLRGGSSNVTTLLTWELSIPGTAGTGTPAILKQDINTDVNIRPDDTLTLEIGRTGGTAATRKQIFDAFSEILMHMNTDGTPVNPHDFDSFPVQARPLRSLRSVDNSDPSGTQYSFPDRRLDNNTTNHYQPIGHPPDPTTGGNGWTMERQNRGVNHPDGTDINIVKNGQYNIEYSSHFTFEDRTNDPGNPDEMEVEMWLQPNGTNGGTNGFENGVRLTGGKVSDLTRLLGDMDSTIDTDKRMATWGTPDELSDKITYRNNLSLLLGHGIRVNAQGIAFSLGGMRRLSVGLEGEVTSDPGELGISFTTLNNQWSRGSSPVSVSARIKDIWSGGNPTSGSPSTFATGKNGWLTTHKVLYDSQVFNHGVGDHSRWALMLIGHNQAGQEDWNVDGLQNLKLNVTWWGDDDVPRKITLSISNRAFQTGDKIYFKTTNVTRTTHNRAITINNQKLDVANAVDVTGREITATGNFVDGKFVGNTTNTDSRWWYLDSDSALVAHQDMRQMTVAVTVTNPTLVKVWRQPPGLRTRELVAQQNLGGADGDFTLNAKALAVVAGEKFSVEATPSVSGAVSVDVTAQTLQSIPGVQTSVGGLLQAESFADTTVNAASGNNRWRRITLHTGQNWGRSKNLYVMISDNKTVGGQLRMAPCIPTIALQSLSPLPTDRLGKQPGNNDDFTSWFHNNREYLLSPLADGGLAICSVSNNPNLRVVIFSE